MKRYGYPVLLTAVYVTVLLFVFSSDYSEHNTFLFNIEEEVAEQVVTENVAIAEPLEEATDSIAPEPEPVVAQPAAAPSRPEPAPSKSVQHAASPEGSGQ